MKYSVGLRHRLRVMLAGGACAVGLIAGSAQALRLAPGAKVEPELNAKPAGDTDGPSWLDIDSVKDESLSLRIATRDFVPREGRGPRVRLIGVAHIADEAFYDELQLMLDACDLVLYESVKPSGAGGATGTTPAERIASTEAALQFIANVAESCRQRDGSYPADLDDLRACAATSDPRLPEFIDAALVDAWGRTIRFGLERGAGAASLRVASLGADGRAGGTGPDADLTVTHGNATPAGAADDNLQAQLARALRLAFQLEAIDYSGENWQCSDMAMDQVERALAERGIDFAPLEGTLAGSSLPAQLMKALLGFLRFADAFLDGVLVDSCKAVMIEILGDEETIDQSLAIYGAGFAEVIIGQRNQVVIDDLQRLIKSDSDLGTVAVFYGAAHMPDMAERLGAQLDYVPADERWLTAMHLDLARSAMTPRDLRQIRMMVKWTMSQQRQQLQRNGR